MPELSEAAEKEEAMRERPAVTRVEAKQAVGPGWGVLLDPVYDYVETHGLTVLQVKEKFGGLTIYTSGAEPDAVQAAWSQSQRVCEWGGQEGANGRGSTGWYKTLCKEHRERWEKGERWPS